MMTDVFNCEDNTVQTFSLPAKKAVIAAFEQARGNNNPWSYNFDNHPQYKQGKFGHVCGNFWAQNKT